MKAFILIFFLIFNLYAIEDRKALMDSISQYAIRLGTGENKTYTFVDPLCPKSKAFIELILERKKLQEKTSYYIFLYRLPKFESDKHIQYIYQSSNPLEALKELMIYEDFDELEEFKPIQQTLQKIDAVAKIAKQIKIKKRPYLLIFTEGSNYCRVSEGTAPCLEENSFK